MILRVKAYLELIRPPNSLMSGLGAVLAIVAFLDYNVSWDHLLILLIAFTTGFTLTASSMIINDIVDVEVDKVNKPWKPLPRGEASAKTALITATTLTTLGVLVNTITNNYKLIITTLIYTTTGITYNYLRKHWWSHTLVAFSTTGPIIYGYIASNQPQHKLQLAVTFTLIVFLATLGREILKAIQDYRGDLERGYSTIATKYGLNTALKTMITTGLLATTLAITSTIIINTGILYKTLITITTIIYMQSLIEAYKNNTKPKILEKSRKKTLIAMSIGLIAFWLSGI